jgi:tRNA pseudouridine38-40 synthase
MKIPRAKVNLDLIDLNILGIDKLSFKNVMNREKIINDINLHLPPKIRIFSIKCVTRSFNVKKNINARHYEYLFPLSCLSSLAKFKDKSDSEIIEEVNKLLQLFKGTKNFHNYTKHLKATDSQSKRYMIELETVLETVGDVKVIIIKLYGQSFLYHQIRKMVGSIIQILVNDKDENLILNSFASNKMNIWLAPSCGLLLDGVSFKSLF